MASVSAVAHRAVARIGSRPKVATAVHEFHPDEIRPESHPAYGPWRYVAPLPSPELMGTVGAPDVENFLVVGDAWSQVIGRFLPPPAEPGPLVLDVGCGCGRIARFLLAVPGLRYVGFDIMRPSIEWCRRHLEPLAEGRFAFHHVDAFSRHYNPGGRLAPGDLRFPCEEGSVDLAFGASLFTHLLEPDARHYLAETSRVLRAGGRALYSVLTSPEPGRRFSGAEDRIDVELDYFVAMAEAAGLELEERLGELAGQETVLLRVPSS